MEIAYKLNLFRETTYLLRGMRTFVKAQEREYLGNSAHKNYCLDLLTYGTIILHDICFNKNLYIYITYPIDQKKMDQNLGILLKKQSFGINLH